MPIATYLILPFFATSNGEYAHGQGNNVFLFKLYVPATITVTRIVAAAATSEAGKHYGVGLYDLDGNLVLDSGPMAMTGAANEILSATISATVVDQGTYWFTGTTDSLTATLVALIMPLALWNGGVSELGEATNASSGGQLPATTGTITTPSTPTAGTDRLAPYVKLQA